MPREIGLPRLGQTMEEASIVSCLVNIGDEVKKGNVIFEIETDKATLEMESPADGFVKHILAEVGQTLPVGQPLMVLADKDEEVPQSFIDSLKARTGPGGKITKQDVKKAAESKPAVPPTPTPEIKLGATIPLTRTQKITAEKMLRSKREIPCFYLSVKADVTNLVALREKLNKTKADKIGTKISYNDFIIRAVALGLEKFAIMTGQVAGDTIRLADSINIGLAISVPDGLVAPVVKDVNKKNIAQIASDREVLVEKARSGRLTLGDLQGGCITVSNLGGFGVESFIPIAIPGQCSILGVGRITDTCMPDDGNIVVRKLMNLTLSVDHRVTNGAYAAEFLDLIRKLLEDTSNFV